MLAGVKHGGEVRPVQRCRRRWHALWVLSAAVTSAASRPSRGAAGRRAACAAPSRRPGFHDRRVHRLQEATVSRRRRRSGPRISPSTAGPASPWSRPGRPVSDSTTSADRSGSPTRAQSRASANHHERNRPGYAAVDLRDLAVARQAAGWPVPDRDQERPRGRHPVRAVAVRRAHARPLTHRKDKPMSYYGSAAPGSPPASRTPPCNTTLSASPATRSRH